MIFVALGTQDMSFKRLLDYLENSHLEDEIIVQAGYTKYQSNKFKIYQYLDKKTFEEFIDAADYVICHGGVGSIVDALKKNKKVLAIPRLSKYKEHYNDHQLQIVSAYYQKGYILEMLENDNIDDKFEELKRFKPKKFKSNNQEFINKLKDYLEIEE